MKSVDVARAVVESKQAHVFKQNADGSYQARPYPWKTKGGVLLDLFSASALVTVFDNLNPENQEKLLKLPLVKAVMISFKLIK